MSLAQRFERRLEGLVGGAFARVFKGQVEPVEIGTALQREASDKRNVMGNGQVLCPNRYRVTLSPSDHDRLVPWEVQLTSSLAELVQEYEDTLVNPYVAADRGYLDAVIRPSETRAQIIKSLRMLRNKRESLPPKKHGNIPL